MFKFLEKVIMENKTPVLPPEYAVWDTFNSLYQHTSEIKNALGTFAKGELDLRLVKKGATSGSLKAILANLSHLAWQFKVAASGDYSHTVDFMGDFSEAFNLMTASLRNHEIEIKEKQKELAKMADELKKEIHRRDQFEAALKESENNYRNQALHDPLTHIYNRAYFNESGKREVEFTRRQGTDLCLLMMDLDFFKNFNDTYGHLSGDAALIHVTKIINEIKRNTDIFARYGGEEFVLLLPQTNFAGGLIIAERLKSEIASRPDPAPNCAAPLTISIGLATLSQEEALSDPDPSELVLRKLLAKADEGLYLGKKNGRNQVCWVGMDPSVLSGRCQAVRLSGQPDRPEEEILAARPAQIWTSPAGGEATAQRRPAQILPSPGLPEGPQLPPPEKASQRTENRRTRLPGAELPAPAPVRRPDNGRTPPAGSEAQPQIAMILPSGGLPDPADYPAEESRPDIPAEDRKLTPGPSSLSPAPALSAAKVSN
jgi:diguanylate cyclase (GGDEF)-like protein